MSELEAGEELLAAIDEAEIIDVIPDALGDPVKVGVLQAAVLIGVEGSPGILDTAEGRDRFAKAWAEACRRADAWKAATGGPTAEEIARCDDAEDVYHRCRVCYDYAADDYRPARLAGRVPERVPEAAPSPADPGPCPACRRPLSGHERGSDGVTYLCPVIGSACIASHPEDGEPCEVKGPHGRHRYTPYAGSGTGDVQRSWTDADSLAHAIRHGLPVTLVHDEATDAASAADAARDAREAWNDPEGGDSRDVQ